jgi:hypothetical protein
LRVRAAEGCGHVLKPDGSSGPYKIHLSLSRTAGKIKTLCIYLYNVVSDVTKGLNQFRPTVVLPKFKFR